MLGHNRPLLPSIPKSLELLFHQETGQALVETEDSLADISNMVRVMTLLKASLGFQEQFGSQITTY